MSSLGSVTAWIRQLRAGDPTAAAPLWHGYCQHLISLARHKLRHTRRGMADEEDVALSAFDSFCRAAAQGRFPQLNDRDDLWQLLLVITERKAIDLINYGRRAKRGGGKVRHEGSLASDSTLTSPLDGIAHPEPGPDLVAAFTDQCRHLLDALADKTLRAVALAKLEGYTNKEIADRLELSTPAIERKLQRIRKLWEKERNR
jgi:DNA-directed RNA polymerase specialized sigma24 family protein